MTREASDAELMALYAAGNPDAFRELFDRYEARAHRYFLKRVRSREEADDLYQELFLRLHRFRDRYDPGRPFAPWFFRIARRIWLDSVRRRQRPEEDASAIEPPLEATSVESQAIARDEVERLLAQLSAEQATVLVAAKLAGAGYGEIAREHGKSLDAVKQAGSRALRKLRYSVGRVSRVRSP